MLHVNMRMMRLEKTVTKLTCSLFQSTNDRLGNEHKLFKNDFAQEVSARIDYFMIQTKQNFCFGLSIRWNKPSMSSPGAVGNCDFVVFYV